MRKVFVLFMLMFFLTGMNACKEDENIRNVDNDRHSEHFIVYPVSDAGVFYMGNDGLLHIVLPETGEDSIFCFDPNCNHLPVSEDNEDPKCTAALYSACKSISYYEGRIYFFVNDTVFEHDIYTMDVSKGTRKKMASLPVASNTNYGVVFHGDYMYYTAVTKEFEDDMMTLLSYEQLVEVNINDGSYRMLTELDKENPENISKIRVTDNIVYVTLNGKADGKSYSYIKKISLETLEETIVIDKGSNIFCPGMCYGDDIFYANEDYKEAGILNTVTNERKALVTVDEEDCFLGIVKGSGDGLFYSIFRVAETEELVGYFFYDLSTGKTTDITQISTELELCEYFDYCEMFYSWIKQGVVSRETVLKD